jgi:hypothetical protein
VCETDGRDYSIVANPRCVSELLNPLVKSIKSIASNDKNMIKMIKMIKIIIIIV